MAGYSKGIVDTRKLNKNNKAGLGRRGDTKIREVGGRDSHVNALEAYLIDVNGKAGEEYAKRVGAGTVNPLTGMPEYHEVIPEENHPTDHTHGTSGDWMNTYTDYNKEIPTMAGDVPYTPPTGRQDYETLSGMNPEELEAYLKGEFDMPSDSMQYIEPFAVEPFGFLGEAQALTTGRAGDIRGFAQRGLESAYGATIGALGSQQETLSRTTGRGLREAGRGRDIATSRSGLATSGTITQGYETQKKDLFQDYAAGTKDIGRQRGTALEQLTLGKEEATATEQYTIAGAGLDFRTAEYAEKKKQLDQMYADVGDIKSK